MTRSDSAFGFEYIETATFREMNFGRLGTGGQPVTFAGSALPRDGFRVCRRCGTVQTRGDDDPQHTATCSARKAERPDIADCLYLYREFSSEAVQMLLPVLDTPGSERRVSSFVAALELGLRRHFSGRIDHLRATTRRSPRQTSVAGGPGSGGAPEDGGGAAHQYLLLYDTVPSGTGYLKELMTEPEKLLSVFEKAREALKSCVCNQDPEKDGCYRCVFAYRRSREMAETSRDTAIDMLDRILAHRDEFEEVPSLRGVTINATFDSELEARFVEALRRIEVDGARAVHVRADLVNGKPGYVLKVGARTYYMETPADLDASDGVVEPSRPDFLIRPARPEPGQRPVAVFTDGFEFHRDATSDDSLKRMALARAGFLVWSLTWHDLEFVFGNAPDVPDLLAGAGAHDDMAPLQAALDDRWDTAGLRSRLAEPTLMLLVNYLRAPEPTRWKQAAFTALFGLFDQPRMLSDALRADFDRAATALPGQTRDALGELTPPIAVAGIGAWHGSEPACFDLFTAFPLAAVQQGDPDAAVVVVHLHDDQENRQRDGYRRIWNGVLRLFTLLQFLPGAWWTTRTGVERNVYPEFPPPAESPAAPQAASGLSDEDWDGATDLAAPEVHDLLGELSGRGAPVPEVGCELVGAGGAVLAEAELGWPAHRVAVLLSNRQADVAAFEAANWQAFTTGGDELAEALADALADGTAPTESEGAG